MKLNDYQVEPIPKGKFNCTVTTESTGTGETIKTFESRIGRMFGLDVILKDTDDKDFDKRVELAKKHLKDIEYIYFYGYKNGHYKEE